MLRDAPGEVVDQRVRRDIRRRARRAGTDAEAVGMIFDSLKAAGIDPCRVDLEQYKQMVVEALRAARQEPTAACCTAV